MKIEISEKMRGTTNMYNYRYIYFNEGPQTWERLSPTFQASKEFIDNEIRDLKALNKWG